MIERALKSKSAVSVLNEDFNDIDVYVEDTAAESKKIYAEILSRIFENRFKIDNVIPLGGSNQVIKQWRANKKVIDGRPKVYLIDGDYHLLNGSLKEKLSEDETNNHKGLFILPRYCIENYLVDVEAFVEIIYEENLHDDRKKINENLKFEFWISENNILTDLFIYNSICVNFKIKTKTSKYKYHSLLSEKAGICCKTLVSNRIEELKKLIHLKDKKIDIVAEYKKRKELLKNNFLVIATGKDYLYPLVKKYICDKYAHFGSISDNSLKVRLAKICNIDELKNIKDYMLQ